MTGTYNILLFDISQQKLKLLFIKCEIFLFIQTLKIKYTRMHSSRMHTARLLTVFHSMFCTGGLYLVPGGCVPGLGGTRSRGAVPGLGGVPGPGGYLVWGPVGGGTWSGVQGDVPGPGGWWCQVLPPVNRMTNRCKNITLPQTSFAGGKNSSFVYQN